MENGIVIKTEGIKLRLVEKADAEFIVDLRTDKKLGQNISWTSSSVEKQISWIEEYKIREAKQQEFYFIFEDLNRKRWGTVRLYDLENDNFTVGSWICLPGNTNKIAVKSWLLCVEFGFEKLNFKTSTFDVRKKNKGVMYYTYLYHPKVIREDELSVYFILDKDTFYKNRERIKKLLDIQ